MTEKSKAAQRREDERNHHRTILERWFAMSDWTMERLIAEIEATPRPLGLPAECPHKLFDDVRVAEINGRAKIAIMLAGQYFANSKNYHDAKPDPVQMSMPF